MHITAVSPVCEKHSAPSVHAFTGAGLSGEFGPQFGGRKPELAEKESGLLGCRFARACASAGRSARVLGAALPLGEEAGPQGDWEKKRIVKRVKP